MDFFDKFSFFRNSMTFSLKFNSIYWVNFMKLGLCLARWRSQRICSYWCYKSFRRGKYKI